MPANPNGSIAIVFTYAGKTFANYDDFLSAFHVTLPGGGGVVLGTGQYYGHGPERQNAIQLGTSVKLADAVSAITDLLPTHAVGDSDLAAAFTRWADDQAACRGHAGGGYANLYLSYYTGGRIYLSNGDLMLGPSGEPGTVNPKDPAYDLAYGAFEPFIGAQVGSNPAIPGNGVDITDIDWFSFPISVKVWSYDAQTRALKAATVQRGGSGPNILDALRIGAADRPPTNEYPNRNLPDSAGKSTARRVVGPTMSATSGYYTDPAQDKFPYHYFDTYLLYLADQQKAAASLFTLTGAYAGVAQPAGVGQQPQEFSFEVDFRNIIAETIDFAGVSVERIKPDSTIKLTGHTFQGKDAPVLGSQAQRFTIEIPWARGAATYSLRVSDTLDALAQRWLAPTTDAPVGPSGIDSPVVATALDEQGQPIAPLGQTVTNVKLVFSVNKDPTGYDDLWLGGHGSMISVSGLSGLTMRAGATLAQNGDGTLAPINIKVDAQGKLSTITIDDAAAPLTRGSKWTIAANGALGNNQAFSVVLAVDPPLHGVCVLATATYPRAPASLKLLSGGSTFELKVLPAGMAAPTWVSDPDWTTLSQPAGIYGANTGYTISGLDRTTKLDGEVKALHDDVFGWIVGDLLAALNVGFVGSPVEDPGTGHPIGQSPGAWFSAGKYEGGLWGAKAWQDAQGRPIQWRGKPIGEFWNTWAHDLFTVAGGTDAYGFAFTDRFAKGILAGFDPPPAPANGVAAVLLEVIVDDSPLLSR